VAQIYQPFSKQADSSFYYIMDGPRRTAVTAVIVQLKETNLRLLFGYSGVGYFHFFQSLRKSRT